MNRLSDAGPVLIGTVLCEHCQCYVRDIDAHECDPEDLRAIEVYDRPGPLGHLVCAAEDIDGARGQGHSLAQALRLFVEAYAMKTGRRVNPVLIDEPECECVPTDVDMADSRDCRVHGTKSPCAEPQGSVNPGGSQREPAAAGLFSPDYRCPF